MTSERNLDLPKKEAPTSEKSVNEILGISIQDSEIRINKEMTNYQSLRQSSDSSTQKDKGR